MISLWLDVGIMMFYYLFPTFSLISFLFLIASNFKTQTFFARNRFFFRSLFAGFLMTFLFCLGLTSLLYIDRDGQFLNPFNHDFSVIVTSFSGQLFFTTLASSYCQFLIVPAVVGILLYEHRNRPKSSINGE